MADTKLDEIAAEILQAEISLHSKIEKLYGRIETTDFAKELNRLKDAHDKLIQIIVVKPPVASVPTPASSQSSSSPAYVKKADRP